MSAGSESSAADWLAAWGQLGGAVATTAAVVIALWVALGDRRQRRREALEEETQQARLITIELKLDATRGRATICMTNNSAYPIFQPGYENFSVWHEVLEDGAPVPATGSGLSTTAENPDDYPATSGLVLESTTPCEILRPGESWDDIWSGLQTHEKSNHSWRVDYYFTDAAGRRWRRTNYDEPVRVYSSP